MNLELEFRKFNDEINKISVLERKISTLEKTIAEQKLAIEEINKKLNI